jgi:hypothetical protein
VPSPSTACCQADSGKRADALAHPLVDLVADREADAGLAAARGEGGSTADVGADEDLSVEVLGGQLLEGKVQDLEGWWRCWRRRCRGEGYRQGPAGF